MTEEKVKGIYETLVNDVSEMVDSDKALAIKFLEKVNQSVNATLRRLKTFQKAAVGWDEETKRDEPAGGTDGDET